MHDYDDYDEYDDGMTSKYDGAWDTVVCLDDRFLLTITYLEMLAEERDGYFSDDDILDAAEKFTMDEHGRTADRDGLVESVYRWLEDSEESCEF